jgi:hypothetical protein
LVPFFDTNALAEAVIDALARPRQFHGLRAQARRTVLNRYDLQRLCLPMMLSFIRTNDTRKLLTRTSRIRRNKVRVLS